jgi:hypothetical protein
LDSCVAPQASPIIFNERNSKSYGPFDVIETTYLADHIEPLILLAVALSLPKQSPSVTLGIHHPSKTKVSLLLKNSDMLFSCDPTTTFTLFGYDSIEHLNGIYHCCGCEFAVASTLDGYGESFGV